MVSADGIDVKEVHQADFSEVKRSLLHHVICSEPISEDEGTIATEAS